MKRLYTLLIVLGLLLGPYYIGSITHPDEPFYLQFLYGLGQLLFSILIAGCVIGAAYLIFKRS